MHVQSILQYLTLCLTTHPASIFRELAGQPLARSQDVNQVSGASVTCRVLISQASDSAYITSMRGYSMQASTEQEVLLWKR